MPDRNPREVRTQRSASDPAVGAVAINYGSGNQVLDVYGRAIYVSGAGHLAVVMVDGSTATFSNLVAGVIYSISVKQITQAGSTATGLVLL